MTTPNAQALLLSMCGVRKSYGEATPVLRQVDLRLEAGETMAIVGPSGCGKSTLLNLAGGLDRPDAGQITFAGDELAKLDDRELAAFRRRQVGFVFQMHHLLPQYNVLENVLIPTMADGHRRTDDHRRRAEQLLERVGLQDRLKHRPGQLSGGERQRVAVVRALINSPRLLLADEPTGALNQAAAEALVDLLLELNADHGVALILVTHANDLAAKMSRLHELKDGRLA